MSTKLHKEIEVFEKLLPSLMDKQGKFAVIHDDDLLGVFDTYADALEVAYEKCALDQFLVRQISAIPQFANYTRSIVTPCH